MQVNPQSALPTSPQAIITVSNEPDGKGAPPPANSSSEVMSLPEKHILSMLIPESETLNYPTRNLPMQSGPDAIEYVIPDADRERLLRSLYPFQECPKLDDIRYDLHEQRFFVVKDFRVIREMKRNFLVSPFYPHTGGMVIDWMVRDVPGNAEVQLSR